LTLYPYAREVSGNGYQVPVDVVEPTPGTGNLAPLLRFFVISVFAATATELAKLKPIRRGLLILGRYVVTALAFTTLKNNIIAWHLLTS
jgi:hypothetical protein